uniref:Histone deacetylase complex subunit SAP30 Sin3 binding domain-containing protein n=1 Tax=Araucaria cunninghamii TaxID=56994 RepID=A0A0D6R5E1_ARACU
MQVEGCAFSPCGDGEEEDVDNLSVLPKNTKVIVTGNNRTNSGLIGLHGVVKKAVGFGWHWLVLTNGDEVKLQRNALSVTELPTGQEDDGENECENPSSNNNSMDLGSEEMHKSYKPKSRSRVIGGSSRNYSHSAQLQSNRSNFHSHGMLKVDLSKLEISALWRYWRHFNLVEVGPNPSKDQLVCAVERHFISQQLDELQVITGFVQAAKRLKTVCS